jgi:hypothetical protein
MVLLPELPEKVRVPVGALFDGRHVFHLALDQKLDLFAFLRVEQDLSARVEEVDLGLAAEDASFALHLHSAPLPQHKLGWYDIVTFEKCLVPSFSLSFFTCNRSA